MMTGPKLDFRAIAAAALGSLDQLLHEWLPGGRREGHEYKALNPTRGDGRPGSFSINLTTGAWGDFATDDKGGDAISLYAYLNGISQGDAAKALAARFGIAQPAAQAPPPASAPASPVKRTDWVPIMPVPADAPEPPRAHVKRRFPDSTWTYRDESGAVLGLIYRFPTSDGGKEILPCCYAYNEVTGAREWRWLAFPVPRPLYGLATLGATRPVLIVEGEKCADAAAAVLGGPAAPLSVITWPGGSKAVDKANWRPLAGRSVLIWPDCDAQRAKDGDGLLAEHAQPGVKAAERIAEILVALEPPAKVKVLRIPAPGARPSGWDVADAIADGWTGDDVREFVRNNQRAPACERVEPISTQQGASAGSDRSGVPPGADDDWERALIWGGRGLKDCRENVIYILRDHPAWSGVLGADTFAKTIVTRKPSVLGHAAGVEWAADDDIKLALWLAGQRQQLVVRSPDTIRQAVQHVAKLSSFHPVHEFFGRLTWDGEARVDTWAARFLGSPDNEYTRRVGRYFLINVARRVYEPGCIMRSVPVLEGPQDKGKSTALRILARPWFSDTPFRVGDKDSYQQIQGVLVYEISELESFTRAEATAVKAFVSSVEDNFRAPYERQNEKHKRQTVFSATTNAVEYLKDWTGNTRFWPLPTGDVIDLVGLEAAREQLLAEAVELYRRGERTYPTADEQRDLFEPEQSKRLMMHPWQDLIADNLEKHIDFRSLDAVSVRDVLAGIIKIDMAKLNPQGSEAHRVGQILHALGWKKQRLSTGSRPWVWARPPRPVAVANEDDDIPF